MNTRRRFPLRFILVIATALALPGMSFAQIKVITSGGFAGPLQQILPEFEKTTGITVITTRGASQGTGPNTIGAQLRRGEPADVVIMSREGLDELITEGKILARTDVDLAQTPLGLSVRAGAPKPDIRTVEAFKQMLLRAKSITFPGSTTGIYLTTKLFPQLGVASEISSKITNTGIAAVSKGEAEIAIQPVSELLNVAGTEYVGPIPESIQYVSVFTAAKVTGSKETDASDLLIAYLTSERSKAVIRKSGMEPSKSR